MGSRWFPGIGSRRALSGQAAITQPVDLHVRDSVSPVVLDPGSHQPTLLLRKLNVLDRTAPITDKVKMAFPIGFIHIEGAPKPESVCKALIYKDIQIAVHVTETQRGKLVPQLVIDPVGGDVNVSGFQQFKNPLTLFALSHLGAHDYNIVNGAIVVNES